MLATSLHSTAMNGLASISLELVRDGNLDCADGTDEGSVNYYMMDVNLEDENGNLLFDEDG